MLILRVDSGWKLDLINTLVIKSKIPCYLEYSREKKTNIKEKQEILSKINFQ